MTYPRLLLALAVAAAAGPSLLAYNVSPSPTFLNQALALALWGGFVAAAALVTRTARPVRGAVVDAALPLAALGLVLGAVLWSWVPGALPSGLALSALGLLLATVLLLLSGAAVRASAQAVPVFALFCAAWVLAGVLNALLGALQVFCAAAARRQLDRPLRPARPRRGQPAPAQPPEQPAAVVGHRRHRRCSNWAGCAARWAGSLFALMCFAVVLTASRTGVLGVGLLALWGLLDRRLSRPTRGLLLLAPLVYAAGLARPERLGRSQPPCLRRRSAAGRGRPVGLALRHLGQHARR